jgi:N-acyl-phosphatidylethanolamine-hydrolysing phospholipase D
VQRPTFLANRHASNKLRATWLGHACYYIEFPSGLRVLFDPVFEERCSPLAFLGPKRFTPAPCEIADLPAVDAVLISHDHYDHLSLPTVIELHRRHPNATFFVGLGLEKWFRGVGINRVVEMDWWQDADISLTPQTTKEDQARVEPAAATTVGAITARISCLPSQHQSGRRLLDRNSTLWCSWAVSSATASTPATPNSVWFAGDTGYRTVPLEEADRVEDYSAKYAKLPHNPQFAQIGVLRGPFDLGLIPIGAYKPRYLFSAIHANPIDAVDIFQDTKCRRAMAIHWGTWVLTHEDVMEPPALLRKALAHRGLPTSGVFDVCDIGESREF